jgi:hypothetical protein
MHTKYYRSLPEPAASIQPPATDESGSPLFTLVCLERNNDPDSLSPTGYDYWMVQSENEQEIDAWAAEQDIEETDLPTPITFHP